MPHQHVVARLATLPQLAVDIGVGERALGAILRDLPPDEEKEGPNGKIERRWFIHRVIKHINSKKNCNNGHLNLDAERARLAKEQADEKEVKNALLRGETVRSEDVSAAMSKVSSAIVQILESIPIRLKRANPTLTQSDLDIVRAEIVKARNAAADYLP